MSQRKRTADSSTRAVPESVDEAMAEAMLHARRSIAEALRAGRSLLDAASLAVFGGPARSADAERARSDLRAAIAGLAAKLDEAAEGLAGSAAGIGGLHPGLMEALMEALGKEIDRWEQRSAEDPDARAVLRAFLGLRELLWELGAKPAGSPGSESGSRRGKRAASTARADASETEGVDRARARVRRLEVQS